jgi:hypothetical protein
MADDDTTAVPDDDNDAPAPLPNAGTDDPSDLPESVKQILAKERKAARDAERARKAAEAKAKEYEDRDKTEAQKLEDRASAAEGRVGPLEQENARLRVAIEKGLPADLVDRLRGGTVEELSADADALLTLVGSAPRSGPPPSFGGGARTPAPVNDMNALIRQQVAARRGA